MSALSDLVYGKNKKPWPHFTDKYPVKVQQISGLDNDQLERDIREAGDHLQGRTAAKCLMTQWDMHTIYDSFVQVSEKAREIADACPLATKTDTDGNPLKVPLYLNDTWGLIYTKGQSAKMHNHWPSLWSYTYCVEACKECAPLIFNDSNDRDDEGTPFHIFPETGQLIVFPAWINHMVSKQECEHQRVMVAGNLNVK